jgi:hypothetical protein
MARCKNTTVFYIPSGNGGDEVKAVLRCGWEAHDESKMCSVRIADSKPSATLIWSGDHGPIKKH